MTDNRSLEQRRRIMQSVGRQNTAPEMAIRKALFERGYRFRIHRKDLPGSPDIVFPGRKTAIFVHGCYWHGHDCQKGRLAKSRIDYWGPKIDANRARDARNLIDLQRLGWQTIVVWQCELKDREELMDRLERLLGPASNSINKTQRHL